MYVDPSLYSTVTLSHRCTESVRSEDILFGCDLKQGKNGCDDAI
jgi:hypothetical protein